MTAFRYGIRKLDPISTSSNLEAAKVAGVDATVKNNGDGPGALIPVVQDLRLRKILHLIESHPSHTIHDLALECNLSGSRLQHLFKQRTGLGLGQLLTEQRMRQAAELLVNTEMSIKQIAGTLGYEHASSFTRAFERRFRQSPRCYRQAQNQYQMPTGS